MQGFGDPKSFEQRRALASRHGCGAGKVLARRKAPPDLLQILCKFSEQAFLRYGTIRCCLFCVHGGAAGVASASPRVVQNEVFFIGNYQVHGFPPQKMTFLLFRDI